MIRGYHANAGKDQNTTKDSDGKSFWWWINLSDTEQVKNNKVTGKLTYTDESDVQKTVNIVIDVSALTAKS